MKTKTIHLTLALLASAAATAREPEGDETRRPPPIPPLFAFFDADHDGTLSAAEIKSASEALGKLDQDGDGEISRKEMRPPRPDGGNGPQGPPPLGKLPPPPLIAALDADKDGTISAEELEGAPESLKTLDENADGELSPEELHPHGPPPPPHEGGESHPQGPPPQGDDGEPMEVE
jgi:hypothetical protein